MVENILLLVLSIGTIAAMAFILRWYFHKVMNKPVLLLPILSGFHIVITKHLVLKLIKLQGFQRIISF